MICSRRLRWSPILLAGFLTIVGVGPSPAPRAELVFRATPVEDTLVVHDDLWVEFYLKNTGSVSVPIGAFATCDDIGYIILDESGGTLPHGDKCCLLARLNSLMPGEVRTKTEIIGDLMLDGDNQSPWTNGHLGVGEYDVISSWYAPPMVSLTSEMRVSRSDTCHIVVIPPTGRDSLALLELLSAQREAHARRTPGDKDWIRYLNWRQLELFRGYRGSPYAAVAFEDLRAWPRRGEGLPPGVRWEHLLMDYFLTYPNRIPATHLISDVMRLTYHKSYRKRIVTAIRDSVPDTRVGRTLAEILDRR